MSSAVDLQALTAHGLTHSYAARAGRPPVLDGIDLTVAPGTRLGLIGENGTGKAIRGHGTRS